MKLSAYTLELLNDIERRIIPEVEEDYIKQWETFWKGECRDIVFSPSRKIVSEPAITVKQVNINDALDDYELMLDMQLALVSSALSKKTSALGVRSNYGTGIMTTLFGAEIFRMPYKTNTLPSTRSFNDSDRIRRILDAGAPDLTNGFGKDVFNFGEICAEVFQNYPKISKYVYVYHPDTQGPLDIAELLWGSEMFYEMYDDPDFVHAVMQLITDTYIRFMDRWFQMYPIRDGLNVHWGFWMQGGIMLRNDSAINLSPELYREFALKYDTRLLDYYGGGAVHFCGKGDNFIGELATAKNLTGINLSQPHLNDMDKIFHTAFSNGKKLVNINRSGCEAYIQKPDAIRGMLHCV